MNRNFYFRNIADAVAGAANFSGLISASPSTYGLIASQSTSFAALNTALQNAQALAIDPSTRTPVAIDNRNIALKNMRNSAKLLAKIIYATPTVNDAQFTALGLLPRPTYNPAPPVTGTPTVEIVSVLGRLVKIRLHNQLGETRSSFPNGVKSAQIYTFVGDEAPEDPSLFTLQGTSTRTITELLFPQSIPNGSTVWVSAYWVGTRGQYGIGSQPLSFILQGGSAAPGKIAA